MLGCLARVLHTAARTTASATAPSFGRTASLAPHARLFSRTPQTTLHNNSNNNSNSLFNFTMAKGKKASAATPKAEPSSSSSSSSSSSAAAPEESQEPVSTAKRDDLRRGEEEIQQLWEEGHVYEWDAPAEGEELEPKFMATFPYPYMNGRLHLGHCFTVTKAEFTTRFQRLLKKRAIFPFGLHCTGMPIKV